MFILSLSIAVPILFRPFYYAQIKPLQIEEQTGLTEEEIETAYNEMLDYCLGGKEFSTGVLKWSESGKSHFTDVRKLFLLDLWVLGISGILLLVALCLRKKIKPARLCRRGFGFWAGAGLGGAFLLVGGLAAIDFNQTFTIFHSLFFPGKTNWIFDPRKDEIINILPEAFFRNCAILILSILVLCCVALIVYDLVRYRKHRKNSAI